MGNEVLRGAGREPRTAWSWLRKIVQGGRRWQEKLRSGEGKSLNQLASTCSNVFQGDQSSYRKTSVSFATVVQSMKLELRTKARLGINRDKRPVQYSERCHLLWRNAGRRQSHFSVSLFFQSQSVAVIDVVPPGWVASHQQHRNSQSLRRE